MKDVADTLLALEVAEQHVAELKRQLNNLRSKRSIFCAVCNEPNKICDLTLIKTKHYISPHGCTGGDYWLEGEWQFNCLGCAAKNRIFFNGPFRKEREDLFKSIYRNLFKTSIEIDADNRSFGRWIINNDVDSRREQFELLQEKS